jgi:hypothetical protein
VTGWERVSAVSATNNTDTKSVSVDCPAGKKLLGGGGVTSHADVYIYASYPVDDDTWTVSASEESLSTPTTWAVTAWAICASV